MYDRWGNILYNIRDVDIDDPSYVGWNGMVGNQPVNPGVYVWIAQVRYIDGEVEQITGDITVFK